MIFIIFDFFNTTISDLKCLKLFAFYIIRVYDAEYIIYAPCRIF